MDRATIELLACPAGLGTWNAVFGPAAQKVIAAT
jgi:hypothetical protein